MKSERQRFFNDLFQTSTEVIEWFPLTVVPPGMAYIDQTLASAVSQSTSRNPFTEPPRPKAPDGPLPDTASAGLNTIGMLLDRLSILAIKHWNLQHRAGSPEKAHALVEGQIAELINALAEAREGQSSINNKMTNRQIDVCAADFSSSYFGLLTTNLLLWESQEVLYNHDISTLPCEELRAYIDFFSRGNITRNAFIQAADETYWRTQTS